MSTMTSQAYSKEQIEQMAGSVPVWFHSINLGHGVVTKGIKPAEQLSLEVQKMRLPDLTGKSVLDINTWDGYFAFEAERRGASSVVGLDHYMWSLDPLGHYQYYTRCKEQGITPEPYHQTPNWQPETLPGKIGYDTARRALNSRVETIVADFMDVELEKVGTYDVVFFLGSLYHMQNPLEALRRVAAVTKELAVIETQAAAFPGFEDAKVCEFYEANELNGDVTNWWAPNDNALKGMCRAAGFRRAEIIAGAPSMRKSASGKVRSVVGHALREFGLRRSAPVADGNLSHKVIRYRSFIHAWK
jgi:tRNA (mo5U34)-methyltransferase